MGEVLVDSTVAIDASNNHSKAVAYVTRLLELEEGIVHAMVIAEVLSGTRDAREQARFLRFLRQFRVVHANEVDSEAAIKLLVALHLSHNVGFEDCLIAATALRLDLPVVTLNERHFRLFRGLRVIRPY